MQNPEGAYQEACKIHKERFCNPVVISANFEKKLATWPEIGVSDSSGMEEFNDFLQQVKIASEYITSLRVLNYPSQIQNLMEKFPSWFISKWSDKVLRLQRRDSRDTFLSLKDFLKEVCYCVERINIPQTV